jgi:iron(III) transport system substrate-binding protein
MSSTQWLLVALVVSLAVIGLLWFAGTGPHVVLYSAQDEEFATAILERFREKTGLRVAPKYDTEANKSVSLYNELVQEAGRPRCDVFWNNEPLATIRLQRQGLLQPYASPSAAGLRPFPPSAKSGDDTWHAFATRCRVLIVNKRLLKKEDWPQSLLDLSHERYRGRAVMAKPIFGTTATQAACLFDVLGTAEAERYYRGLKTNQIQIAPGNKQVAEWVGQGATPSGQAVVVGVTDTDDALEEMKAGHDVAIVIPDRDALAASRMGVLFIPNTLAILKDCPNPEGARRLVDYLLSAEVEEALAKADSHQIPFRPEVNVELPPPLATPPAVKAMQVDFYKAAELWDQAYEFLRREFE